MKNSPENAGQVPAPSSAGQKLRQSAILIMLALVALTAGTYAWFSIADSTRVRSMGLDVTSGSSLRFDITAHDEFLNYSKTLNFQAIFDSISSRLGYDPRLMKLEPVTSRDGINFFTEDGVATAADSGQYLEFVLHFMASQDMVVHLTSNSGALTGDAGTLVETSQGSAQAVRISFTSEERTVIYQPSGVSANTFTLPPDGAMVFGDNNALFSLEKDTDKPVTVRIWLEGTDAECTDDMRGADYSIRMRFEGTDSDGNLIE